MEYNYVCLDCGTRFSISVSVKDLIGAMFSCPNCKGYNIKRLFSPVPVIYKADGYTKRVEEKK